MQAHRIIFHVDMDAFFASVEQRDNPAWRGKPLIVGALPGNRGVVCAASYEARRFGVRSAMPVSRAHALCPQGIFVQPRMQVYAAQSRRIMDILASFTPCIEQVSVDEAFMDMSGTQRLWGTPLEAARVVSRTIRAQEDLTASIGVAGNKYLAKLASDCNKPDGITVVPGEQTAIERWLAPMPVGRIWGVGAKTEQELAQWGIKTIADLQRLQAAEMEQRFGSGATTLYALCRGIDHREVAPAGAVKSISREHTFGRDCSDRARWHSLLLSLAHEVARQARSENVAGRTVFITWRTPDFTRHTRRLTLPEPVDTGKVLFEKGLELLDNLTPPPRSLRLLGIGITNFTTCLQTDLFGSSASVHDVQACEKTIDTINRRFGRGTIFHGGEKRSSSP